MQIDNLFDKDLAKIEETIKELKKENPEIQSRTYNMITNSDIMEKLQNMQDKIDWLIEAFNLTFEDHVLIDGKWENTKKLVTLIQKHKR